MLCSGYSQVIFFHDIICVILLFIKSVAGVNVLIRDFAFMVWLSFPRTHWIYFFDNTEVVFH